MRHSLSEIRSDRSRHHVDCAYSIYRIIVSFYLLIACNTYRKRWNNCRLRNHHFGIYEHYCTRCQLCECECVCNEVVRSPQRSVCWKRNLAQMRLTKLGGSSNVFGYMHSAWMTNITNRFLCSIVPFAQCFDNLVGEQLCMCDQRYHKIDFIRVSNLQTQRSNGIFRCGRWMYWAFHYTESFYFDDFFSCHSVGQKYPL